MTQCKKCSHSNDCWIKSVLNNRVRMPDSERDQDLVIDASSGHCALYEDRETAAADSQFKED